MTDLEIRLIGPLNVLDRQGLDRTPKAPRVRALVALLAEPPLRKHSRKLIVSRLWSDRPFEKSSMSLRQALVELRKALGLFGDIICADRNDIWFDPARVRIDLETFSPGDMAGMTLLEGLDVPDDAFDDWLRDLRAQFSASDPFRDVSAPPVGISVVSSIGDTSTIQGRVTAGVIADQISQNLEDMIGSTRSSAPVGRGDIEVTTHISETYQVGLLSAQVIHGPSNTVLYSGHREIERQGPRLFTERDVAEFSHSVTVRALAKLPHVAALDRDEVVAIGFSEVARRRLFSYKPGEVEAAGQLFSKAYDADPGGIFLAWQAFQRTALVIEGMNERTPDLLEECEHLVRRAQELSPESAQAHGLVALVRLLQFDDPSAALSAAEAGLRRNRNCLLSRQALAMIAGAFGDKDAAYVETSFCRPALVGDDARHLWDLYHGLVCISIDRYDEALGALRSAARRCPSFKAPHRQLIALNMHLGDTAAAQKHVAALSSLEDAFSLEAYLLDEEYPVSTLRSKGLLNQTLEQLA